MFRHVLSNQMGTLFALTAPPWYCFVPHYHAKPVIVSVAPEAFCLSFSFFSFYLSVVDMECYISFRCTTWWFDKFIHYAVLTTSVATICPITSLLQYHWLFLVLWFLFLWLTHSITGGLYLSLPFTNFAQILLPSLWQPSVCSLYL